jgi:hypothetical protein
MWWKRKSPAGTLSTRQYILDANNEPRNEPDRFKWAEWLGNDPRRILQQDSLSNGVFVSTVFTGLDPRALFPLADDQRAPRLLWETVIFGGPQDEYCKRYSSKEEALAGHQHAVRLADRGT